MGLTESSWRCVDGHQSSVDVGVDDGGTWVGLPKSTELAAQQQVVMLGELVQPLEAACCRIVRLGVLGPELGEEHGDAPHWEHAGGHHRLRPGSYQCLEISKHESVIDELTKKVAVGDEHVKQSISGSLTSMAEPIACTTGVT